MNMLIKHGVITKCLDQNKLTIHNASCLLDESHAAEKIQKLLALPVVAIEIDDYHDGRIFTFIRNLKTHHQYKGEIRLLGNYLIDQMSLFKVCGVDAFVLSDSSDSDHALFILNTTPQNIF